MIITMTVNPAMDRVLVLDRFRLNVTNRIVRQFDCVGGKGTHISINLGLLGIRSTALGVVMGSVGAEILAALGEGDIDVRFFHLPEGNSRTNYVLVDADGNCTLVAEKGNPIPENILDALLERFSSLVTGDDFVVISGDGSNLKGGTFQGSVMEAARKKGARVCLDTSGVQLLHGVRNRPFLIKPNVDELSALAGRTLGTGDDILSALDELSDSGIPHIVVSRGGEGSIVFSEGKYFIVSAPAVEVKNTVGCGDALLAGLLAGFEQGLSMEDNLRRSTAVAAATAMDETTVGFDVGLVSALAKTVTVTAAARGAKVPPRPGTGGNQDELP